MIKAKDHTWLSASSAAEKLGIVLQNGLQSKDILADNLRDGHLRARAKMVFISEGETVSRAWARRPAFDNQDKYLDIQPSDWRASKRWNGDRADWRWPVSNFSITRVRKPVERVMYRGVELSLEDLKKLQPSAFNARKGVGGNGGKMESRDAFWNAIVQLALQGRLNREQFANQGELIEEVRELAGNDIYQQSRMAELARQVWQKYVEPKT